MSNPVQQWLKDLGFEQFTESFDDNAVDWELLCELTNEDLKDLGVARLADRKKMLSAIRAISTSETDLQSTPDATVESPKQGSERYHHQQQPKSRVEAEYRLLSVMFCDLVGSTALASNPEQLRATITRFQHACALAVETHRGFVARYMGDGVLVYFGYPKADENDAERAVAAGLAVVSECAKAIDVGVRVGIATGRVIVGDLLGDGPAEERTVIGTTPNLAARLQSVANPGCVVVSDTTRRLAGGGFEFTDLGAQVLKGFDDNVKAFGVSGTRAIESRFESNRNSALNPLFGRSTELMLLMDRWELAAGGEGQAAFICGEAGIGKSRLLEALRREVSTLPHRVLRYQCSPHFATSAFYPLILQVQRTAKLSDKDTVDQKLDKLEAVLRVTGTDSTDAQIFAHLLSIPFEHRYGALDLSPQQIKTRTLDALLNQVILLSEKQTALFIVEDTHWIDPASEEFLELLIGRLGRSKVLLVVTHRLDWQPQLHGHNNISSLQLNRLGKASCASIVRSVGGEFISDDVVERIISRTDGIPLFIEELTKSLMEAGLDIAEADIPETLQASLLARIDRLAPEAKEIIQIAAVIGREVFFDLLQTVARDKQSDIQAALNQLVQAEFLFQSGTTNSSRYTFKHGLVQDSIYENMLSESRMELHAEVAEAMVKHFPQTVETAPELVAYHYTAAGRNESAIAYWHRAGKRSAGRSADAESVAQLKHAIKILDKLPGNDEAVRLNLALHMDLTGPLIAIGGYGSADMQSNTRRALDLAEQAGETDRIFPVLYGQFVFQLHTGLVGRARELAAEFLELANRDGQYETVMQGHRIVGFASLIGGEADKANRHLTEAAAFAAPVSGGSLPFVYGQDIEAAAKVLAAWAKLHCGYPDQAIELFDQALTRAQHLNHANTLGVVLFHGGNLFVSLRLEDRVRQTLTGLASLNAKHDLTLWRVAEAMLQPGLKSLTGDYASVIDLVEPVLETYTQEMHMRMHTPYMLAQSAQAHLCLKQIPQAFDTATSALTESAETGVRLEDPELLRIIAAATLQQHGVGEATEEAYQHALNTAQNMRMKWYELRISADYATYLFDSGDPARAKALLAPVIDGLTEGMHMPDMLNAQRVLANIESMDTKSLQSDTAPGT